MIARTVPSEQAPAAIPAPAPLDIAGGTALGQAVAAAVPLVTGRTAGPSPRHGVGRLALTPAPLRSR